MKSKTYNLTRSTAWLAALTLLAAAPAATAVSWYGGSTTSTNWSDGQNWLSFTPPVSTDSVSFDNSGGATNVQGAVNNVVDQNFTINDLSFSSLNPNYYGTLIPAGRVLTVSGQGVINNLVVNNTSGAANDQVYGTITGEGSLVVNNSQGSIVVRQYGASGSHRATLDLSGLNTFTASVSNILEAVGAGSTETRPTGTILLAKTNFITTGTATTKPGILLVRYTQTDGGASGSMTLGTSTEINTEGLVVGGHRADSGATMSFPAGTTGNFLKVRGSGGGTSRATLISAGDNTATETNYNAGVTSRSPTGTINLTGGSLDIIANDLVLGRNVNAISTGTGNTGTGTGTLTYEAGTVDVNNLYIGYKVGANYGNAVGTLNLNGTAQMTVNNNVSMAFRAANGTANPSATINIASGATLNVKGDITDTNSPGTSTININGGTLNMQLSGDPTPGNINVDNLAGTGTIAGAGNVNINGAFTMGTALTAGTLNIGGNLALAAAVPLTFNLTNVNTADGGFNDIVNVTGNLNLNSNVLTVVPLTPTLASGTYTLFNYTGTRSGYLSFTNQTRYDVTLDYPPGKVVLIVGAGAPGSVRWNSTASAAWDLTTSNWFNTGSSVTDKFQQFDGVLVDDSSPYTNLLMLSTALFPGVVTVNSSTRDYAFGGPGKLGGAASIVKNGTSSLILSNANDFNGPVTVNAGTLVLANSSALGTADSGVAVQSGATLDVRATGAGLDLVTISGTGLNNTGAVINSGGRADNAIRFLSLADNATVGVHGLGRWDVRGAGGNSSFSALVDLAGHTLTSVGATQFSIVDCTVTNPGNFNVGGGSLALTRSKIEGAGVINVNNNNLFFENFTTGYVTKPIVVDNGVIRMAGATFSLGSPITNLAGGVRIQADNPFTITNLISGPGGVTKLGGSTLTFEAANTYSGPTVISAGRLVLGTNASLAATPSITLQNTNIFDVSAPPSGFTLAPGQTLGGSGSVIGNVSAGTGTYLVPGTSAGTLAFSNNLAMNNVSSTFELGSDPSIFGGNINDLITVSGSLTLNGVNAIKLVPLASLNTASPYTLFTYSGTFAGGLANLAVDTDSRYGFTLVDPALTPGSIQVNVTGSGSAANLLWLGNDPTNPTFWNTKATTNWLNGATPDYFLVGDNVAFDDTASSATVNLVGTLQPAAVGITNNTLSYTFGGSGNLLAGSLTKEGSASLTVGGSGANTVSLQALFNGGTATFSNSGGNTFASGAAVNAGTLLLANAAPNVFAQPLSVNGGSVVFDQPIDLVFAGVLTDNALTYGSVEKKNNNILTLSGNNVDFDGPITVSAGTLRAQNSNALGANTSGTTIASGATLDINGYSLNNPGDAITISGSGVDGRGAILNDSPNEQQNAIRSVILANNAAIGVPNRRWDIRGPGGNDGTFSGNLSLAGFTLAKLGPGQISVVDANVIDTGIIDIQSGLLAFTRCNVEGPGYISVRNNILLLENYSAGSFSKPVVMDGGTLRLTGNSLSIASSVTNQTLGTTVDVASGLTLTVQGTVTGPGALTKITAGTLTLTAIDNSWVGGTRIDGGTLRIGSGSSDGSIPDLPITNNATLTIGSLLPITLTREISGTGTLSKRTDGVLTLTASNSFSGNVTTGDGNGTTGAGGTIVIRNSYALGNTNKSVSIVRAELQLEGPLTIPSAVAFLTSANSDVADAGAGLVALRNMTGNNVIQGPITLTSGAGSSEFKVDAGQLTLNGDIGPDTTSRVLILSGVGPGTVNGAVTNRGSNIPAVEKRGDGTWTLNAINNYSGRTTVRGGTLTLGATASIAASSPIDVQTNTTLNVSAVTGGFVLETNQVLKGGGTILGNVTAKGTITPGESIGTLTFANALVLAGTNVMEIDRTNAPMADLLSASALTFGGSLIVTNIGEPLVVGDTFDLYNWTTATGTFSETALPVLPAGQGWDTSRLYLDGTIKVIQTLNLEKTNLTYQVSSGVIEISWPADKTGMTLQAMTNAITIGYSTNWFAVPGSTATNRLFLPIDNNNGSVFYRLVLP